MIAHIFPLEFNKVIWLSLIIFDKRFGYQQMVDKFCFACIWIIQNVFVYISRHIYKHCVTKDASLFFCIETETISRNFAFCVTRFENFLSRIWQMYDVTSKILNSTSSYFLSTKWWSLEKVFVLIWLLISDCYFHINSQFPDAFRSTNILLYIISCRI